VLLEVLGVQAVVELLVRRLADPAEQVIRPQLLLLKEITVVMVQLQL
jgi:hypothetical protein